MDDWQTRLVEASNHPEVCEYEIFACLENAAIMLGFQFVCYGFRPCLPLTSARFSWLSNYPAAWKQRYAQANYLDIDPTIHQVCTSPTPLRWAELPAGNECFWQDARNHGLNHGCSHAILDEPNGISILSLARSGMPISGHELHAKQCRICWLTQIAHQTLSRAIRARIAEEIPTLTEREIEILKWSADGKSAQDIADILTVSKRTVDFHIKNSVAKLNAPNKTAAVVRAILLGLFW